MLRTSDNYLAEVGPDGGGASGKPASNDGAVAAVLQQLEELKIPAATLRAADLAGLTLENKVSARQLAAVVRAMTTRHGHPPPLRPGRVPRGRADRNTGQPVHGHRHFAGAPAWSAPRPERLIL